MAAYTLVQLGEVALFAAMFLVGIVARQPSAMALAAGLLLGKAVLNIIAAEGGSLLRRSLIGYAVGLLFAGIGVLLIHGG